MKTDSRHDLGMMLSNLFKIAECRRDLEVSQTFSALERKMWVSREPSEQRAGASTQTK